MKSTGRLWRWLGAVFVASFAVLGWMGREIYLSAPPIADVKSLEGTFVYSADEVQRGQQAWLAAGGQQLGTVWGHGSYVAPDWSADWLHREAVALRELIAQRSYRAAYGALDTADKAAVDARVKAQMRTNTYDAASNVISVSGERQQAIAAVQAHYEGLFGDAAVYAKLREQYAMPANALPRSEDRKALAAFFFWSAWSAATDRPGESGLSYTSNWPHEPIVGNTLTTGASVWTIASIILLIGGIAAMIWFYSAHREEADPLPPAADPLLKIAVTPSMKATRKYFFVVIALLLVQIGMGAITAHYAVEGQGFFGIALAELLPYTVSRSIHTQFGVF